jgi:hypothetical protein
MHACPEIFNPYFGIADTFVQYTGFCVCGLIAAVQSCESKKFSHRLTWQSI